MPDPSLTDDQAAVLAARIAAGACWQAISAALRLPIPKLKRHAAKLRLAHDAPGDWPQIIDPDECDDDGVARPLGDPLLEALEGCHSRGDVRDVPVRRGTPRRVTGSASRSLHGSPAAMNLEAAVGLVVSSINKDRNQPSPPIKGRLDHKKKASHLPRKSVWGTCKW